VKSLLVLHGPNLNLLGTREPDFYGRVTLDEINAKLVQIARSGGANLSYFQSNAEAALVERAQQARQDGTDFIIINPAAFTHTSVALRDALAAVDIPFIEVHLSNVFAREAFRKESYFSDIAVGVISGLGATGYELAVQYALRYPIRS
jgi:3-dehydroquinate dehydratase-2